MLNPEFSLFGEHAILLDWPREINPQTHETVLAYDNYICSTFQDSILETVLSYHSLLIFLKQEVAPGHFLEKIKQTSHQFGVLANRIKNCWEIPVCYDLEFGWDLEDITTNIKLSLQEIISLHTKTIYHIYFTGFLPGFVYLGGLDKKLILPRKPTPRLSIPKGSVAIGGHQTGIYPIDSPGGWNILGRTPIILFDQEKTPPSPFEPGDELKFYAIDKIEYERISTAVENRTYQLKKTTAHD